jgi:HTH-type transcriptional regulator/antitoxin MqsA
MIQPMPSQQKRTFTRATVLSNDACPECGTIMLPSTADLSAIVNEEKVTVPDVQHLRCPACGEVLLGYESAKALQERGVDLYRQAHGLLGADEIRALRQRLGLTQAQFAALLHLGLNTVSRWESGRNVQSGAMDLLLKIIRDVPGTLGYLKQQAA